MSDETPYVMWTAAKQHLLEAQSNEVPLKANRLSQRSVFKSQTLPALFFYEALCGWEEPKNNLHNMVEKKLIPQPHLLLWVRLLIYRFMAGRVLIATSRRVCARVQQHEGRERRLCAAGRGANWQIMCMESCGGIPPSCVSSASALQQPLQPGFIKRDTGGPNRHYLLWDKNGPHQAILYWARQHEREQFSEHLFTSERECSKAHSEKRNSHICRHKVSLN